MSHPSVSEIKQALEDAKVAYSKSTSVTYHLLRALEKLLPEGEADLIGLTAERYTQAKQAHKVLEEIHISVSDLLSRFEQEGS